MVENEVEEKIIKTLPIALRNQLLIEANKIVVKDSPIFVKNFGEQVI